MTLLRKPGARTMTQRHRHCNSTRELGHVYDQGPERRIVMPNYPIFAYYDLDERAGETTSWTIQHTHRRPPGFP